MRSLARTVQLPGAFLAAAVCLMGSLAAFAEIAAPGSPPPQPAPATMKVDRGGTVDIPLRIFGITGEQIRFKIRTQPKAGTLSNLRIVEKDLSAVTYTHSGEAGRSTDAFTFSSQSSNGVSAPAQITIQIVDKPALLIVPASVDFETAIIGRPVQRTMTMENRGGGLARGVVTVDPPWQLESGPVYRLAPGERKSLTFVFDPHQPRGYRSLVRYSSDPRKVTTLTGKADTPFAAKPVPLVLEAKPGSTERSATLSITNRLDTIQEIRLDVDPPISVPNTLTLPPESRETVTLTIPADQMQQIATEVTLRSELYVLPLPLRAPAPGALLRVEPSELKIESAAAGEIAEGQITVANDGGRRVFVRPKIDPPFSVAPKDAGFPLDPGEQHTVTVQLALEKGGRYSAPLILDGYDTKTQVNVSGIIPAPVKIETSAESPQALPSERKAPSPRESIVEVSPPTPLEPITMPRITKFSILELTRNRCTITWPPPAKQPLQYQIEERILSINPERKLRIKWIPVTDAAVSEASGQPAVTFEDLRPGHPYTVRVTAIDPAGGVSPHSPPFRFITNPPRSFKVTPLHLLLIALMVIVALIARRRLPSRPAASPKKSPELPSPTLQGTRAEQSKDLSFPAWLRRPSENEVPPKSVGGRPSPDKP